MWRNGGSNGGKYQRSDVSGGIAAWQQRQQYQLINAIAHIRAYRAAYMASYVAMTAVGGGKSTAASVKICVSRGMAA